MKVTRVSYSEEYGATITLEAETEEDDTVLRLFFDSEIEAGSLEGDQHKRVSAKVEISTKST